MRGQRYNLGELGPMMVRIGVGAALAVFAVLLIVILGRSSGDSYEVTAVFDDVRGVIEGGDVTAGSIQVGTVTEVNFGDDGVPFVRMRVDEDFRLHQGAFANIRLASNVGAVNRSVDLEQGDAGLPELEDGATLGPSQTDQPVDLDLAVSTLDPATRADAARLLAGLDLAFRGRGDDFRRTLEHSSEAFNETANLLAEINLDSAAISSIVTDTGAVVSALAAQQTDLGEGAEQTASLLRIAAERQEQLRRTVELLGPGLRGSRLVLERLFGAVPNLRELVSGATPLVEELEPLAQLLPPTISALRPALDEANELVKEVPPALIASQPALEAILPLTEILDPTIGYLNPFLDHLRVRTPEIVGTFQLFNDGTANYDANGNVIRAGLINIQTPRHTEVIGPDESGPGVIASPFARIPGTPEGEPWMDYADSFIGGGPSLTPAPGGSQ